MLFEKDEEEEAKYTLQMIYDDAMVLVNELLINLSHFFLHPSV